MKKLLLAIALVSLVAAPSLHATRYPHLMPLWSEVVSQQAGSPDKPTGTALRKARTTLERNNTVNLVNSLNAFSSVAATLNKSSLSNAFDGLIRAALTSYINDVNAVLDEQESLLATARPSGPRTAAENLLGQLDTAMAGIAGTSDTTKATKDLAKVAKKLAALSSLVTKARNVPAGPDSFSATITGSNEGTFSYTPSPKQSLAGVYNIANNLLTIASTQIIKRGRTVTTRTFIIQIPNPPAGTSTYSMGSGSGGSATAIYNTGTMTAAIPPVMGFAELYQSDAGSLTITHDVANKNVYGTFEFSGNGQNNGANQANVTSGRFSLTYKQ